MAERIERVTKINDAGDYEAARNREVEAPASSSQATLARIIWFVAGVLLAILGLRFVLALLGANPDNAFASFIYNVSHPFVAPFFSLFNYDLQEGRSRFELYTLIAMAVYALIAWALVRLVTINRPAHTV